MAKENDLIPMRNSALAAIANKRASQESGTKTGDPIIKTKTVDPDTGAVTYKHSWSDTAMSSKPTTRSTSNTTSSTKTTATPRRSSPTISSVGSKKKTVTPVSKTTSGSREFTSVAPLTPAGKTDSMKPSAPLAKITEKVPTPTKEEKKEIIYKKSYESSKKEGESFNDWYKKLDERTKAQSAKNRSKDDEGEIRTDKQMAGGCRGCR